LSDAPLAGFGAAPKASEWSKDDPQALPETGWLGDLPPRVWKERFICPRHRHAPGPGDVYLPDCQNSLPREYWRAFRQSSGTAYLYPIPEVLFLGDACANSDDPLNPLLLQYGLCFSGDPVADVDVARSQVDAGICSLATAANCPAAMVPPCSSPVVQCVEGRCQYAADS
jgi:hypothetical protein